MQKRKKGHKGIKIRKERYVMENNKYGTTPLVELFSNMAYLERDIDIDLNVKKNVTKETVLKAKMYNEMRNEVIRRWPMLEKEECFKEKQITKRRKNGKRY